MAGSHLPQESSLVALRGEEQRAYEEQGRKQWRECEWRRESVNAEDRAREADPKRKATQEEEKRDASTMLPKRRRNVREIHHWVIGCSVRVAHVGSLLRRQVGM